MVVHNFVKLARHIQAAIAAEDVARQLDETSMVVHNFVKLARHILGSDRGLASSLAPATASPRRSRRRR